MADYLMHFNPNHDPKTGRFDFAVGGSPKAYYDGQEKREYKKKMAAEYRKEGYSNIKANRFAKAASEMNKRQVEGYNINLKNNKKYISKLNSAKAVGDTKNIEKYSKKAKMTYRNAAIFDELLSKNYELGKSFCKQKDSQYLFGLVGGMITTYGPEGYGTYYNQAKELVESRMNAIIEKERN